MRHLRSRATLGALLSAATLMLGNAVKADIIPVFDSSTPNGGNTTFSYTASVASGSRVNTGDYFTIYDFNGYVAGSEFAPVDWSISVQNVGITPAGQLLADGPSVVNLTFTYTGAASLIGPVNPIGGPGAFGADSTSAAVKSLGQYSSMTHKQNPGHPDHNTPQSNQGYLVTPAAVPETSSLMLLVPGLVPLGMVLRRRARKE
jgi:hypothetical protein